MENPTSNTQALPAGTRLEEFVIERVLGSGGFGITYLARDTRLDRRVVIKENLPAQFCFRDTHSLTVAPRHTHGEDADNFRWSLENFSKEAAMLASLDHPGIVKVLRSFEAFGTAYFVMPFVEGRALDELASRREGKPFSETELRRLLERVLDALAYLHDRGIYHRDIKPGNILMTTDGLPVLIDFGSARQRLSDRSMTVIESAGYTPFEQLQSRGNVGPWSDLYALAATLVKVMTGEAPPNANDRSFGDPWQPLANNPALAGKFSKPLLRCLDRALKLPIEERWQSAEDWKAGLGHAVVPEAGAGGNGPTAIQPEKVATQEEYRGPRRSTVVISALLLAAAGAWWLTRADPQGEPQKSSAVPAGPTTGGLVITSEPSGADLTSATGELLGKTPVKMENLPAGQSWRGSLVMDGYVPAEVRAGVVSGEMKRVAAVRLREQPQKVMVSSEPSGAEVVEGGTVMGTTPWESSPRAVGAWVDLTIRKLGYDALNLRGDVPLGNPLILQGTLKAKVQHIFVSSEPSGAKVLEKGKLMGMTPLEMGGQVPGTKLSYTLKLEGYEEGLVEGTVRAGEPLRLSRELQELAKPKIDKHKAGEEREFEIAPGVRMTMCWIPQGDFMMGSPAEELGRYEDEIHHRVRITEGFWLGKYEVTQVEWLAVMGKNPSRFVGDDLPVGKVSWNEIAGSGGFIGKVNQAAAAGGRFSLPTEAQWEYACRAGATTALNSGKNLTSTVGKCGNLEEVSWYGKNSGNRIHAVGGKKANAWGLHDTHGNVCEWCKDWYDPYKSGLETDPEGAVSGRSRVLRGGGWDRFANYCRSASRYYYGPDEAYDNVGFRLARSSVP